MEVRIRLTPIHSFLIQRAPAMNLPSPQQCGVCVPMWVAMGGSCTQSQDTQREDEEEEEEEEKEKEEAQTRTC